MAETYYTREEKNALNLRYYHERKERNAGKICRSCTEPVGQFSTVFCDGCYEKAAKARWKREGSKPRPLKAPKLKQVSMKIKVEGKPRKIKLDKPEPKRPKRRMIHTKSGQAPINYGLLTTMKEREANPIGCLAQDIITVAVLDHQRGECDLDWWYSKEFYLCCDVIDWHPDYIRRNLGVPNATEND